MAIDLDTLKSEVDQYLASSALTPFYGLPILPNDGLMVYWDTRRQPDFRAFFKAGEAAGAKLMVVHEEQFSQDEIDDVVEQLAETNLDRDEKRAIENRLRELQKYEGFTSRVELSFCLGPHVYSFQVHAEWYRTWEDLVAEIDSYSEEMGDLDDDSLPGYYSAN